MTTRYIVEGYVKVPLITTFIDDEIMDLSDQAFDALNICADNCLYAPVEREVEVVMIERAPEED